jgi:hypothetical protein
MERRFAKRDALLGIKPKRAVKTSPIKTTRLQVPMYRGSAKPAGVLMNKKPRHQPEPHQQMIE